ncbi:tryptophanyl-tRNA synthetase [Cantharellus anzutake]|uniref:tryptophanyl-tRNA synthetase n=1 Tax=Cantharellus anzutake TaxID=1750568 RepID=UPI0019077A52|nr:tryptophanyl-tRNA synthetase [Cantharellus anzutake]KAF8328833.1 tryptophanyl-tRNA synthetase [Cantharellus anzutake]
MHRVFSRSRPTPSYRRSSSFRSRQRKVIFSGIQPTGVPHLGNYLGALVNWVHLQKASQPDDQLIYSVVGLHAITLPQDPAQLRQEKRAAMATLLAIGIDPTRSILFHQDEVSEHAELAWILGCLAPLGRLNRMTTYKAKISTGKTDERLGLFSYPVLQAADILLYKATHVPVGEDQRQHLELTRDLAQAFNQQFRAETFHLPQDIITPSKRIFSLRDSSQKMSKSAADPKSRIGLTDTADEIALKIRKAITDSSHEIVWDPKDRPGVSNLLTILHACTTDPALDTSATAEFRNTSLVDFKSRVAEAVESRVAPIRSEFHRLNSDEGYIQSVSRNGAERARSIASRTLQEVKSRIGLEAI